MINQDFELSKHKLQILSRVEIHPLAKCYLFKTTIKRNKIASEVVINTLVKNIIEEKEKRRKRKVNIKILILLNLKKILKKLGFFY